MIEIKTLIESFFQIIRVNISYLYLTLEFRLGEKLIIVVRKNYKSSLPLKLSEHCHMALFIQIRKSFSNVDLLITRLVFSEMYPFGMIPLQLMK